MDKLGICQQFKLNSEITDIQPLGEGHIHDTYHVFSKETNHPGFLLQRINHEVFRDVEGLDQNLQHILPHLKKKVDQSPERKTKEVSMVIYPTHDNQTVLHWKGMYWRMFNYIPDHKVYEVVPGKKVAEEGGRMFGQFIIDLSDLPSKSMLPTIPDFHNVVSRYKALLMAERNDEFQRVKHVTDLINWLKEVYTDVAVLQQQWDAGVLPARITHNDVKINNILFNPDDTGKTVIDLDTTMPGIIAFDFGDGVRTFTNPGREDATNLENTAVDLDIFEGFATGFLQPLMPVISKEEFDSLPVSCVLFPYLMAIRFLTDYLMGDTYYKTDFNEHNLIRATAQVTLARDALAKQKDIEKILKSIVK